MLRTKFWSKFSKVDRFWEVELAGHCLRITLSSGITSTKIICSTSHFFGAKHSPPEYLQIWPSRKTEVSTTFYVPASISIFLMS